ncbi:hypothetical protein CBR_g52211 [Chara braunii]|uniref:Uncharacterized protein n=1 Tax=Chara braunii TaxID=69332 RepID=A0A388M9X8_CHABU|nr:hypothetical protein CBR_g52211 [Chara braunii]|eukprot:GBG91325.1 hypothetical protein CBR_g52211 [Chara braunii]
MYGVIRHHHLHHHHHRHHHHELVVRNRGHAFDVLIGQRNLDVFVVHWKSQLRPHSVHLVGNVEWEGAAKQQERYPDDGSFRMRHLNVARNTGQIRPLELTKIVRACVSRSQLNLKPRSVHLVLGVGGGTEVQASRGDGGKEGVMDMAGKEEAGMAGKEGTAIAVMAAMGGGKKAMAVMAGKKEACMAGKEETAMAVKEGEEEAALHSGKRRSRDGGKRSNSHCGEGGRGRSSHGGKRRSRDGGKGRSSHGGLRRTLEWKEEARCGLRRRRKKWRLWCKGRRGYGGTLTKQ